MQDCTDRDITNRQVGDGVVAMAEKALLASLQQSYASSFRLAPVHERTVAAANGQSGAAREQPALSHGVLCQSSSTHLRQRM